MARAESDSAKAVAVLMSKLLSVLLLSSSIIRPVTSMHASNQRQRQRFLASSNKLTIFNGNTSRSGQRAGGFHHSFQNRIQAEVFGYGNHSCQQATHSLLRGKQFPGPPPSIDRRSLRQKTRETCQY